MTVMIMKNAILNIIWKIHTYKKQNYFGFVYHRCAISYKYFIKRSYWIFFNTSIL